MDDTDTTMPGEALRALGYRIEGPQDKNPHSIHKNLYAVYTNGTVGAWVASGVTPDEAWRNAEVVAANIKTQQEASRRTLPALLKEFRKWDKRWSKKLRKLSEQAERDDVSYAEYDEAAADMREAKEEWCDRIVYALPSSGKEWALIQSALRIALIDAGAAGNTKLAAQYTAVPAKLTHRH